MDQKIKILESLRTIKNNKQEHFPVIPFSICDDNTAKGSQKVFSELYKQYKLIITKPSLWGKGYPLFFVNAQIFKYEKIHYEGRKSKEQIEREKIKVKRRKSLKSLLSFKFEEGVDENGNEISWTDLNSATKLDNDSELNSIRPLSQFDLQSATRLKKRYELQQFKKTGKKNQGKELYSATNLNYRNKDAKFVDQKIFESLNGQIKEDSEDDFIGDLSESQIRIFEKKNTRKGNRAVTLGNQNKDSEQFFEQMENGEIEIESSLGSRLSRREIPIPNTERVLEIPKGTFRKRPTSMRPTLEKSKKDFKKKKKKKKK